MPLCIYEHFFVFYATSLQRFRDEEFAALGRQHLCENKRNVYKH